MLSEQVTRLEKENKALKMKVELLIQQLESDPDRKPKMCRECKFFIQHYGKGRSGYFKINEGHCVAGRRTKNREAEGKTCEYFEFGSYEIRNLEKEAKSHEVT